MFSSSFFNSSNASLLVHDRGLPDLFSFFCLLFLHRIPLRLSHLRPQSFCQLSRHPISHAVLSPRTFGVPRPLSAFSPPLLCTSQSRLTPRVEPTTARLQIVSRLCMQRYAKYMQERFWEAGNQQISARESVRYQKGLATFWLFFSRRLFSALQKTGIGSQTRWGRGGMEGARRGWPQRRGDKGQNRAAGSRFLSTSTRHSHISIRRTCRFHAARSTARSSSLHGAINASACRVRD